MLKTRRARRGKLFTEVYICVVLCLFVRDSKCKTLVGDFIVYEEQM